MHILGIAQEDRPLCLGRVSQERTPDPASWKGEARQGYGFSLECWFSLVSRRCLKRAMWNVWVHVCVWGWGGGSMGHGRMQCPLHQLTQSARLTRPPSSPSPLTCRSPKLLNT